MDAFTSQGNNTLNVFFLLMNSDDPTIQAAAKMESEKVLKKRNSAHVDETKPAGETKTAGETKEE